MKAIELIQKKRIRDDVPPFEPGDTVRVHVRVKEREKETAKGKDKGKEKEKERIQIFEGLVIGKRGTGLQSSFTVRKMSFGVGVERIFPIYSPTIEKIKVIRHGKVRRAKLYYLREKLGKAAKIKERQTTA